MRLLRTTNDAGRQDWKSAYYFDTRVYCVDVLNTVSMDVKRGVQFCCTSFVVTVNVTNWPYSTTKSVSFHHFSFSSALVLSLSSCGGLSSASIAPLFSKCTEIPLLHWHFISFGLRRWQRQQHLLVVLVSPNRLVSTSS